MNTTIPKIIHAIWFGPEMPAIYKTYFEKWQLLHPDWQTVLWNEKMVSELPLIGSIPFRYIADMGMLSDLARYEILRLMGGFYVDLDVDPYRSFEPLRTSGARLIYADHSRGNPTNFFLGSTPEHPVMTALCNQINREFPCRRIGRHWHKRLNFRFATTIMSTGPEMLRDVANRFFGCEQPTKSTDLGFFIGTPGSYHASLAIWPELFPHDKALGTSQSFGRHLTHKAWYKRPVEGDEKAIFTETLDDTYGIYQLNIGPAPIIVDAGAHCGLFAVSCRKLWPASRVWSIEPNARNLLKLKATASEIGGIDIFEGAVGSYDGVAKFAPDSNFTGRGQIVDGGTVEVPIAKLSRLLTEAGALEIDLLKLDIEGSEAAVLADLKESGWLKRIKHIRLETHQLLTPGIADVCIDLLKATHEIVYTYSTADGKVGLIYADLLAAN